MIVNPYGGESNVNPAGATSGCELAKFTLPLDGWEDIQKDYKSPSDVPMFTNGHIVAYFVTRSVADNLPAGDFKSINHSAENLFRCGHVQGMQVCSSTTLIYIKAICLPEIKKDRVYKLNLAMCTESYDIVFAECGCPAGKWPSGSCKHIGALCYAFAEFCKLGKLPQFLTCTDKLQNWNKPRGRKVDPIPVDRLVSRRKELLKGDQSTKPSSVIFDPRPLSLQIDDPVAVENLRCDLIGNNQPCALLTILVPSTEKVQHDHCYARLNPAECGSHVTGKDEVACTVECPFSTEEFDQIAEATLNKLNISHIERLCLEENTREQSTEDQWHQASLHIFLRQNFCLSRFSFKSPSCCSRS